VVVVVIGAARVQVFDERLSMCMPDEIINPNGRILETASE
jgi:hypothetical protein